MTYRPSMISYDKCIGWDHFQYVALDNWCKLDQTVGLFVFSNLFALRNVKGMRVSIVAPAYLKGKDRPWVPISLWFGCSDSSVDLNIAIANRIKQWQQLVWGRLPYVQPSTCSGGIGFKCWLGAVAGWRKFIEEFLLVDIGLKKITNTDRLKLKKNGFNISTGKSTHHWTPIRRKNNKG